MTLIYLERQREARRIIHVFRCLNDMLQAWESKSSLNTKLDTPGFDIYVCMIVNTFKSSLNLLQPTGGGGAAV